MQNSDGEYKGRSVYFILLNYILFINTIEFMNLFGENKFITSMMHILGLERIWNRYNSLLSNWMETKMHYLKNSCHIFHSKLERLVFKGIPLSTKKSDPVTLKYNDKILKKKR